MSRYADCETVDVEAPAQACFDALSDIERLPEWQSALKAARVLERDDDGAAVVVEYELDAKVRTVRYRLRLHPEPPRRLGSEYLGGDLRDLSGEWLFEDLPGGRTRVQLRLQVDPGRFVPGPLRAIIRDAVMKRALRELKDHVERTATPPASRIG